MIRRIEHTTITARDQERSVAFYTTMLGFRVDREMWFPESGLRIVFLRLGGTELEIFGVPAPKGEPAPDDNEVVGYKHICLLVDSVDEEYARLSAAGVPFRIAPVTVQGLVRIAFLKDPDGLDVELLEYPKKEHQ
ncbi:MAG: VOC family protein [Bacteroidota bacterium]